MLLAILVSLSSGQFLSYCGAGRDCVANSIKLSDGSATAPPISFLNDSDTGFFSPANNQLGITVTGTQWGYFGDNSSLVGANANAVLSLNGSSGTTLSYATNSINIDSNRISATTGLQTGASGIGTAFASFPACVAGLTSRMLYDSTNNVLRVCNGTDWIRTRETSIPTISSGFGTSPSVVGKAYALQITIGSGGVDTNGLLSLNTQAASGWNCSCVNMTSNSTLVCVQCSDSANATGDVSFCSRNYAGASTAFNAGDLIKIQCSSY